MKHRVTLLIVCIFVISLCAGITIFARIKYANPFPELSAAEQGLPEATWTPPSSTTYQTSLGDATGKKVVGKLTVKQPMIPHFENTKKLMKMGYTENMNLSADGPGSSVWGYSKGQDVLLFSYKVSPTKTPPNEPISFDCPCSATVEVFMGTLEGTALGKNLANPASTNCGKVGGTTIIKNGPNGQYGLCEFGDNMACEEWALYRGDCPVGGVKTTGYDNIQQMYCAWVGGKTLAVANPNCKLPNGITCTDEAVYNGTCSTN